MLIETSGGFDDTGANCQSWIPGTAIPKLTRIFGISIGDIRAGTITRASGVRSVEPIRQWFSSFYPGSHPGEIMIGSDPA